MEALVLFIIPLFIYIFIKVLIWRDVDIIDLDTKKHKIGIDYFNDKKMDEALKYFDEQIKTNTKSPVLYFYRGKCNIETKNYFSAIYNFERVASLSNDIPESFLFLGIALYHTENFEHALKVFNKAQWYLHDTNPEIYYWRALTFEKVGKTIEAKIDRRKAEMLGSNQILKIVALKK